MIEGAAMVDWEDIAGTRDSSSHQPSWQKKNHTTTDARFAKVTPFFLDLDFLLSMQMLTLPTFSYSSSLSSPTSPHQGSNISSNPSNLAAGQYFFHLVS